MAESKKCPSCTDGTMVIKGYATGPHWFCDACGYKEAINKPPKEKKESNNGGKKKREEWYEKYF